MDWNAIWTSIVDFFTIDRLWSIVWFIAILVIGIIVIKIVMSVVRKVLSKTRIEKIAQQFTCTILKFVLWLVLILLLLSRIGVEITGILTAFSAIILAVGMALQTAIANVANGIIIISSHMFKKGDYIVVNGVEGNIEDINFLFTTLRTVDNKKVTLPNTTILGSSVTNFGAHPKRRVDFSFDVAYETDVELVKKVVTEVMKSDGRVYLDPAPFCHLKTLESSSIRFFANCWCDNSDYWDVYYYIMEHVYNEFKRNNISIPFNQIEVRERKDKVKMPVVGTKLPKRVEKVREEEASETTLTIALGKSKEKRKKKKEEKAKKKNAEMAENKTEVVAEQPTEVKVEKKAGRKAKKTEENK